MDLLAGMGTLISREFDFAAFKLSSVENINEVEVKEEIAWATLNSKLQKV